MLCMIRLLGTKCITNPFDLFGLRARHEYGIKPASLLSMLLQIMSCGQNQFLLLLRGNAIGSPAKCGIRAHAYFNEHQRFTVLHH